MDRAQIRKFIEEKVEEGLSLSKIQDELTAQGAKMTFMELRLIASEIESDVFRRQEEKKAAEQKKAEKAAAPLAPAAQEEGPLDEEDGAYPGEEDFPEDQGADAELPEGPAQDGDAPVRGKTTVSLSPIQRPGFVACGSVKFGSGPTAEWYLDQTGRLALDKLEGGKPDQQDYMEFQMELRKAFGA